MATTPFETKTVESKQSVVDDKLKPTSEIHILVGGPYTDPNGEEHRYGHTALRVKTPTSDKTYDFGRYGRISGTFGESGEGILRVWTEFQPYIAGENMLKRVTTGFVYSVFDHEAKAANDYFDALIAGGKELPKSTTNKKVYKLASDYHALGPNCTTLSLDGAKQALPKIDLGSEKFNKPEAVLTMLERAALAAKGGSSRLFLPANLQTFLQEAQPIKTLRVDNLRGQQVKRRDMLACVGGAVATSTFAAGCAMNRSAQKMTKVHVLEAPMLIAAPTPSKVLHLLPKGTTLYFDQSYPEGFTRYKVYVNIDRLPLKLTTLEDATLIDPIEANRPSAEDLGKLLREYPLTKEDLSAILKTSPLSREEIRSLLAEFAR